MKSLIILTLTFIGCYAVEPKYSKYHKYVVSIVDMSKFEEVGERRYGMAHMCTGVIIDQRHVLTAATCMERIELANMAVIAGNPVRRLKNEKTQIETIKRTFSIGLMELALLVLSDKLKLDDKTAQSINYTQKISVIPGQHCTLVGWGAVGEKCLPENIIQNKTMAVQDPSTCNAGIFPFPRTFCATTPSKHEAPRKCMYDVGRPMFCNDKLFGIELFHGRCPNIEPTYFVEVAEYSDLIKARHLPAFDDAKRSSGQNKTKISAN